jgi:ParB-like nuclease domain
MIDPASIEHRFDDAPTVRLNIREVTVGNHHAHAGDPAKVAAMHRWLVDNPAAELPPLLVFQKPNGTVRIYDGRHRFVAYVLAERDTIPVRIGRST